MTEIDDVSDDPNEDLEENRRFAREMLPFLTQLQSRLAEQHMAMGSWLVASLLVVNGGGLVALVDLGAQASSARIPAALFATGLVAALATGSAFQLLNMLGMRPLGQAIGYWMSVASDGWRVENMEKDNASALAQFEKGWRRALPPTLGMASLGFFVAGLTTLLI